MPIENNNSFQKQLKQDGLESCGLYYGVYHAIVKDNNDPQQKGRLKLLIPQIQNNEPTDWAFPVGNYAGDDKGFFSIPEVDDGVYVMFIAGEIRSPVWLGGWWLESQVPSEVKSNYPTIKLWKTDSGNKIEMDDGNTIIRLTDGNSNTVELSNTTVKLNGSDQPAVLGDNNADVLSNIIGQLRDTISQLNALIGHLNTAFTAQGAVLSPLVPAATAFATSSATVLGQLISISAQLAAIDAVDVPLTKSNKVELS